MPTLSNWIEVSRPKTLLLSVSGILVGFVMCSRFTYANIFIWFGLTLTAVLFQVLSNWVNDWMDAVKGNDKDRIGPRRLVTEGIISVKQIKIASIILASLSFVLGNITVFSALGDVGSMFWIYFILGGASIFFAIKYSQGKKNLSNTGIADIFVFIFFGLISVIGSAYLFSPDTFTWLYILPASVMGFIAMSMLNINNLRDLEQDQKNNKNTIMVKLGYSQGVFYHGIMWAVAMILIIITAKVFNVITILVLLPFILKHLRRVRYIDDKTEYNKEFPFINLLAICYGLLGLIEKWIYEFFFF